MQVATTTNYGRFHTIAGNRGFSKNHIKRLTETIGERPELLAANPILVNEKNEVIDGQHRLKVAEALNVPVYFIPARGLTLKDVQLLNSHRKPWTPMDYAISFAELGNQNYAVYVAFKDSYHLNHEVLMRYLNLRHCTTEQFKEGRFEAPNPDKSKKLVMCLLEAQQYFKRLTNRSPAYGFFSVMQSEKYNHKRMIEQLKKYGSRLTEQATPFDYARNLELVYNFNQRDDNKVRLV